MRGAYRIQHVVMLMAVTLISFIGTGCTQWSDPDALLMPYEVDTTTDTYVLQPPDGIEIYCPKVPEFHQQKQTIRPDGMITVVGVGELLVAGKTPVQVAQELRSRAEKLYALKGDYLIDVRVYPLKSKLYYVLGEVSFYGPRPYTGRDTVLTALASARPEVTGWTEYIHLVRPSEKVDVEPQVIRINFNKMVEKGDTTSNYLLEEGDILYVPPTPLAAVAMVIEEFVRPIGRALSPVTQVSQIVSTTP